MITQRNESIVYDDVRNLIFIFPFELAASVFCTEIVRPKFLISPTTRLRVSFIFLSTSPLVLTEATTSVWFGVFKT